jgi:hypothetical protein
MANTKQCTACNTDKDLTEFNKKSSTADGLDYKCISCKAAYTKQWRAANRAKAEENQAAYADIPKMCGGCNTEKPRTQFNKKSSTPDGYATYCAECDSTRSKKYHAVTKANLVNKVHDYTGTKTCCRCKQDKPKIEFYKTQSSHSGVAPWCRECDIQSKYAVQSQLNEIVSRAKSRAKELNLPFNITKEYILTLFDDINNPTCPALGIPMRWREYGVKKDNYMDSPSLDRLIPELGYVVGNVAVISLHANMIKTNATYQDIHKVAKWLEEQVLTSNLNGI